MVFERIQKIMAEKFDIDLERITKETSFTEDLELDSLDVAELVERHEAQQKESWLATHIWSRG